MNNFQKTLILGVVLLLVGTNLASLVGSHILEEQTHVATIDDTEPSDLRIIINGTMGNNGWYVSCVTITIIAEGESIWYRFDEGPWLIYTVPLRVCEDGEYVIYAYSIDPGGNQSNAQAEFKIDKTPPMTTHEFDGIIGDNGWYVSDVTVKITATDNAAGVDYTMLKLDDDDWIKKEYQGPFTFIVREDGEHTLYCYSVDLAGNEEDVNEADFKIDQTPPTIYLDAENIGGNTWLFTADVFDETSGVNKVEFYVNTEYIGRVTEPPYEWIYNYTPKPIDFSVRGLILNPKITEETVSFFAVIAIGHSIFNNPVVRAIVYDNAGNYAISPIPTSPININFHFYIFKQLTFSNNYSGYIGRFFINAIFEYGPV